MRRGKAIHVEPHHKNANASSLTPGVWSSAANLIYCQVFNIYVFSFSTFAHQIVSASEVLHNIQGFTDVITGNAWGQSRAAEALGPMGAL